MLISKNQAMQRLKKSKVVAILRMASCDELMDTVAALIKGGLEFIEITMTMPDALNAIRNCSEQFRDQAIVGAGTVLDVDTARQVVDAGAQFVVSPIADIPTIEYCNRAGVIVMPGAMTPTEIHRAWKAGADVVKIFSARAGGAAYFKDIKGPFPQIEILPTGGVDMKTAAGFLQAGACAVGIGAALVPAALVREKRFGEITDRAIELLNSVQQ